MLSIIYLFIAHCKYELIKLLCSPAAEMTQDIVSKGLGVVYDKCSPQEKQQLVSTLVDTLTTGKRLDDD